MGQLTLLQRIQKKIAAFRRERDGVSAIEFGVLAFPFLFLLFAILETGYVFLLAFLLEGAAADGARQVRTGTVQTAVAFETPACNGMANLIDCARLNYDARTFANYGAITWTAVPTDKGTTAFATAPGSIVVVRVALPWTYMTPFLQNLVGAGGTLVASVVVRTEPYI